ncbi:MAG: DUF2851 family protein [Bacteroidetes bacterium]|nr:DUF2851 family protein [Bacteroidota bacterium]
MEETLLHFIWEHEFFDEQELCSQKGRPIEIIHPGIRNTGSGPDFVKARIRVGDTIRIGGVVINMEGSEWFNKNLHHDPDFSNIALHVAFRNIPLKDFGYQVPTLELNGKISSSSLENFNKFRSSPTIIPCADQLRKIQPRIVRIWQEKLITDLLESRLPEINSILEFHHWDWDRTFLHFLIRNFDDKVNKVGFNTLSDIIDYSFLLKYKDDRTMIEAILFGLSGLLEAPPTDSYTKMLQIIYKSLEGEVDAHILNPAIWNSEGLPPQSSPAVKLSQLASTIHRYTPLFSSFQEHFSPDNLLNKISASEYWSTHSRPNVARSKFNCRISDEFASQLIISTYVPVLFAFGKAMSVPDIMIQAIEHLKELKPQFNRKTKMLESLGVPCYNAADSTALVHAVDQYCLKKKCLECQLGCNILGLKKGPRIQRELVSDSYIYN